jgi:MOSC domain-containing protein YiiM
LTQFTSPAIYFVHQLKEEQELKGIVEEIYITAMGSAPMERVEEVRAMRRNGTESGRYERGGIEGDRYKEHKGYWTPYGDICEITLIEGENLDEIEREGLNVKNGEHRRNIITRGVRLEDLRGSRFRVGEAILEYDRPRPPCKHVQDMTEPGMTRALRRRGGICVRVVEGGYIRARDEVVAL